MKIFKTKIQAKLSLSIALIVIIIQFISLFFYYYNAKEKFNDSIKTRLKEIISIASLYVDTEIHSKIQYSNSENNDNYKLIKKQLQHIQKSIPNIHYIYTIRYDKNSKIRFVVDADKNHETIAHLGNIYDDASVFLKNNINNINKPTVAPNFYTDKWGTFLSGYAPLSDSDGNIDAILAIDIKAETINYYHKIIFVKFLIFLLITSLIVIIIAWWYGKRFAAPIIKLTEYAQEISNGNLDKTISIKSNDEIGILATTINTMNLTIQDFVDNIKIETNQSLQESEKRFKALSEATFEAILFIKNGILIDANSAAVKMSNLSLDETIGKPIIEFIAPEARKQVNEKMKLGYDKPYDSIALKKDGSKLDIEIHGRIINYKGEKIRIVAIRDIAERKKHEKMLEELNSTKDKFFSIIAHDLKSPFNTMIGFADILIDDFDDLENKTKKEYISYIRQGAENTYKLLENLLLWSRTQDGSISFNPEQINLYLLINETCKPLNQSANNKSIIIENNVAQNIIVNADENMLSTIIRNLVSNAIKFTQNGGNIEIGCVEPRRDVVEPRRGVALQRRDVSLTEIHVKDTGIGITQKKIDKIFDISENTSTKGTNNEAGTGIGLILCKEFIEKHGGKIRIESKTNKGSTFFFTLPTN